MGAEAKVERDATKWLKDMGAYVWKFRAGPGTPTGAPDRGFFFGGIFGVIEFKASKNAPFRPGQEATLARLRAMGARTYIVYPENWPIVKLELQTHIF